jgi:hypothetical protein
MKKTAIPDTYLADYDGLADGWISTSQLATLMMCGFAFFCKYILRLPEPISVRMTAGTGTHGGREMNLRQKIESGEDVSLVDVQDATRDLVEERFENNDYCETAEFEGKSKAHACDITKDMAIEFVTEDYNAFQIDCIPAGVEESIAVQYADLNRIIVGKIDVRNQDCSIIDLKTSKSAYGQAKTNKGMGLTTYGMLTLVEHGVLPPKYSIHNISRGKTGCKPHLYETTRTLEDIERQLMRFAAGIKVIEAGNFLPCNPEHWKCSPEMCGYHSQCLYGSGKINRS